MVFVIIKVIEVMKLKMFSTFFKRKIYLVVTLILMGGALLFFGVTYSSFNIGGPIDSTTIDFIFLGNKEKEDYNSFITINIYTWKEKANYSIRFRDSIYKIDLSLVSFDANKTITELQKNTNNNAYFYLTESNQELIANELKDVFSAEIIKKFDFELFKIEILESMKTLEDYQVYELADFLEDNLESSNLNTTIITNINNQDVDAIIEKVTQIEIKANARFSLLEKMKDKDLSNEQLSIIASGVQGITARTNFEGFVFVQNFLSPAWISAGQNVRILEVNGFDFTFFNNSNLTYTIEIEKENDNSLLFSLKGYPFSENISVEEIRIIIPFQATYIENMELDETTPNIIFNHTEDEYVYNLLIEQGVNGEIIIFRRTTTNNTGEIVVINLFSETTLPVNAIYEQHIIQKEAE